MSNKRDYYEVLGIDKNADLAEIKKAFRSLAKKYHPDANPGNKDAEAKFKEIQEAYAVLSDNDKRRAYDTYGHDAFDSNTSAGQYSGFGGFDFNSADYSDIFSDVFGDLFGSTIYKDLFTGMHRNGSKQVKVSLTIDFMEAITGCEKEISINYQEKCNSCSGTGSTDKVTKKIKCERCGGTGRVITETRSFFGKGQKVETCPDCNGKGTVVKNKCPVCSGCGYNVVKKTIKVNIPAGIDNGQAIRLTEMGNIGTDGKHGDLLIYIDIRDSDKFQREGVNIFSEKLIPFSLAVLGGKTLVDTVDGSVEVNIPAGTQNGTQLRLRGKGVKKLNSNIRGDHYVIISVEIPRSVDYKQKEALKKLSAVGL